jgi:hypothetical protein
MDDEKTKQWMIDESERKRTCANCMKVKAEKTLKVGICAGMGDPRPNIIYPQEGDDPERYCLNTDNPTFCRTVGDLCDEDGFVKPEYPYCTNN